MKLVEVLIGKTEELEKKTYRRTRSDMPPSKLDAIYRSLLISKFFSKVRNSIEKSFR